MKALIFILMAFLMIYFYSWIKNARKLNIKSFHHSKLFKYF